MIGAFRPLRLSDDSPLEAARPVPRWLAVGGLQVAHTEGLQVGCYGQTRSGLLTAKSTRMTHQTNFVGSECYRSCFGA